MSSQCKALAGYILEILQEKDIFILKTKTDKLFFHCDMLLLKALAPFDSLAIEEKLFTFYAIPLGFPKE